MGWIKNRMANFKENIEQLSIDSSGQLLLCAALDGGAYLLNTSSRKIVATSPQQIDALRAIALSGNGKYAALAGKKLWLWSIEEPDKLDCINYLTVYGLNAVCFSPNNFILAAGGYDGVIKLLDFHQGFEIGSVQGGSSTVRQIAISPDGQWLASAMVDDSKIYLWNLNHLGEPYILEGHTQSVLRMVLSSHKINWLLLGQTSK